MPGLVGFVKQMNQERAAELLKHMASALESEDRFQVDLYQNGQVGLGRVSLGLMNPQPQPIWNEDQSLCLVMEGEIYDYQELKRNLLAHGHRFQINNNAEFALHMYEEFGEDFAAKLNGAFIIAIWDLRNKKLVVVNDRLGLFPLYYARVSDGLIFASGVRALLADASLPHDINHVAIAQFLTFDHMLDDRTLLTDVHLFPQASVLAFSDNQLNIQPYWRLKYADKYPLCSEAHYTEQLMHYLHQATNRQAMDNESTGLMLSGGLDSRILLALLAESPAGKKLHSFTWGIPGCDDARYAKEASKVTGIPYHFFELKPDWLLHKANEAVRITDGLGNIVNLHALAALEAETEYAKVIYKGFMGDAMFGFAVYLPFWADYDEQLQAQAHFQAYLDYDVITFNFSEQKTLFTETFSRQVGSAVMDSLSRGMRAAKSPQMANQRLYFDLTQRVPRMTIHGVEVVRSRAVVRLPFCDNDLIEFIQALPPGMQYKRHLITQAFIQAYPQLAKIPYTETGLPMKACARDVLLRAKQLVQWHLHEKGLGRLAGPTARPYKDYTSWFRTILRDWVNDILLNPAALQRGYFKPDQVRRLVEEHMAGTDHTVKLGAFLAIELWHKQFLSKSP